MELHHGEPNPGSTFPRLLQNFFSPYEEEFKKTRIMDWSCISRSREIFTQYIQRNKLCYIYCKYICGMFEDTECNDFSVIQRGLADYMHFKLVDYKYRLYLPEYTVTYRYMQRILNGEAYFFKYYGLLRKFLCDLSAVRLLFRYGLRLSWPPIEDSEAKHTIFFLRGIRNYNAASIEDFYQVESSMHRIKMIYPTEDAQRRLGIVLIAIHVMNQKLSRNKYYLNSIESFRLIFKTTPQPLVTLPEIAGVLNEIFSSEEENSAEKIRKFCDGFAADCPKACDSFQPRRLKNLTRYTVRKCLTEARKLPHGVKALEIPNSVRNYILMQNQKDEFHPREESPLVPFP